MEWRRLVETYFVQGVQVHDAYLVASMLAGGISTLLTFNTSHFNRYTEMIALRPQDAS